MIDNDTRRSRASVALSAYEAVADDPDALMIDLLTDLLHLAAHDGRDIASLCNMAVMHVEAERAEESEDDETEADA